MSGGGKVAFRERSARTGLEVLLEANRGLFAGELERDDQRPRTEPYGMPTFAVVVPPETIVNVIRDADVVVRWLTATAEDVDGSLLQAVHVCMDCTE